MAAFDSFAGQYARQLLLHVPLTPARRALFEGMRFHNLKAVADKFKVAFDIEILHGLKSEDVDFETLLFHRRHIYEHNGGEADEKYIADSGDTSVRPKQAVHETQESAHRLAGSDEPASPRQSINGIRVGTSYSFLINRFGSTYAPELAAISEAGEPVGSTGLVM